MKYRKEKMSNEFTKHLFDFTGKHTPFHMVVHHFTDRDKGGPHCHPFRFTTHILKGGYTERIYQLTDNGELQYADVFRGPGTTHVVEAECIHELIHLPNGECWTVMIPEEKVREPRFWRFNQEGAFSRVWNKRKWVKQTA